MRGEAQEGHLLDEWSKQLYQRLVGLTSIDNGQRDIRGLIYERLLNDWENKKKQNY